MKRFFNILSAVLFFVVFFAGCIWLLSEMPVIMEYSAGLAYSGAASVLLAAGAFFGAVIDTADGPETAE